MPACSLQCDMIHHPGLGQDGNLLENVVQVVPDFLHLSWQLVFHGSSQCTEESKHWQDGFYLANVLVNLGCNWRVALWSVVFEEGEHGTNMMTL